MRNAISLLSAALGCGAVAVALAFLPGAVSEARAQTADFKIVTGPERGTYIQIGQDLARWVADPIGMDLDVLASKGSAENVQRMRYEPGVRLALVQSDVYQAYVDMAKEHNPEAGKLIQPLRMIMPLYNEEIYFVVRADSPLHTINEIKDKNISVGLIGSGTAQSANTLYRLMFNQPIPDENAQHFSNEDALAKLIVGKIDVAVIVAGQPVKLFQDMNPELLSQIRLLKLDPAAPETARAEQTYFPATIYSASYPNWIKEDSPTLTVKAFLVTYDYNLRGTVGQMTKFADSLCTHFDELQANGHPKWKQVKMELPPLGRGWRYYPPMEKRLRACFRRMSTAKASATDVSDADAGDNAPPPLPAAKPKRVPKRACTDQEKVLMLCKDN